MVQRQRVLEQGEIVRLTQGGPEYRVTRVNSCAAYLKRHHAVAKEVTLPDGRTFLAHEEGSVFAISPTSFVFRSLGPILPGFAAVLNADQAPSSGALEAPAGGPWDSGKTCGECEKPIPSWQQDGTLCPACVEAERVEVDRDLDIRPTLTADDDPYFTGQQQAAAEDEERD